MKRAFVGLVVLSFGFVLVCLIMTLGSPLTFVVIGVVLFLLKSKNLCLIL